VSAEIWAIIGSGLVSILVQLFSSAKTRGEFRSVMRNFPPHRHTDEDKLSIIYSAEYPRPNGASH
jgi:hypothetical protein